MFAGWGTDSMPTREVGPVGFKSEPPQTFFQHAKAWMFNGIASTHATRPLADKTDSETGAVTGCNHCPGKLYRAIYQYLPWLSLQLRYVHLSGRHFGNRSDDPLIRTSERPNNRRHGLCTCHPDQRVAGGLADWPGKWPGLSFWATAGYPGVPAYTEMLPCLVASTLDLDFCCQRH